MNSRFVRGSAFDDEEQWFNQDDEDEDQSESAASNTTSHSDLALESVPSLGFSSSSPPSTSSTVASSGVSTPPATSSPSFTLLIQSSTSNSDPDSPPGSTQLLNRRAGLTAYPPISIHIKSTILDSVGSDEEENSTPRNSLKRWSKDEDYVTATANDGDAEVSPNRHSKRLLLDDEPTEDDNSINANRSVIKTPVSDLKRTHLFVQFFCLECDIMFLLLG